MFGKYAAFIIPAYAITAFCLSAMVLWIVMGWRARKNELAKLEAEE